MTDVTLYSVKEEEDADFLNFERKNTIVKEELIIMDYALAGEEEERDGEGTIKLESPLEFGRTEETPAKLKSSPEDGIDINGFSSERAREQYQDLHMEQKITRLDGSETCKLGKKYNCSLCDYCSNIRAHVKRHLVVHTGERPYSCTICDYKSGDVSTLDRHMKRHEDPTFKFKSDPNTRLICQVCDYETHSKGALSRHLLTHESPFACSDCGFVYRQKASYKNHILLHNGIASQMCDSCDYKTNFSSDLRKHVLRKHTDHKPFACSECNYRTSCRSDLKKHATVHKTARPYACHLCDYTCKRRSHLTSHRQVHEKPPDNYFCSFCQYKTSKIGSLRTHVRIHTGEKPYTCHICGSGYATLSGLRSHEYSHVKDRSQTCPTFNFTTSVPRNIKKHLEHEGFHKQKISSLKMRTTQKTKSKRITNLEREEENTT